MWLRSAARCVSGGRQSQYRWGQVTAHFRGGETEDHPPGRLIPFNATISWGP